MELRHSGSMPKMKHTNLTLIMLIIGGSRGVCQVHIPPWDPILSFSHTFLLKSACIGGPHPLMGPHAPLTGPCPPMGNPGSATANGLWPVMGV